LKIDEKMVYTQKNTKNLFEMKSWCTVGFQGQQLESQHPLQIYTPRRSGVMWRCNMDVHQWALFILERQLFISFFANKPKMNPSKDPPPKVFIGVLKQWITTQSLTKTIVDTFILENYYKCYEIIDIFNLRGVQQ
jgi:hypothetical protein